jgi:hypothetical protein
MASDPRVVLMTEVARWTFGMPDLEWVVLEQVPAIQQHVDVTVERKGVGLAIPRQLHLPERGNDVVKLRIVVRHEPVERLNEVVAGVVTDECRIEDHEVERTTTRQELRRLLTVDLGERHLDDLDVDAGALELIDHLATDRVFRLADALLRDDESDRQLEPIVGETEINARVERRTP